LRKNQEFLKAPFKLRGAGSHIPRPQRNTHFREIPMSVMPLGGPAGPLHSQSQSSFTLGAWFAQAGTAFWSAARPILRRLLKAIAEHNTRRAVRELQSLDDRLLRDIGLTRASIEQAVRQGRELDMIPFAAEWALWGSKEASGSFRRQD
jgi:uncharacterized protein YjiS (DUF1127 family)